MTMANTERLKEVVGQLRLKTALTVVYSFMFGGTVGATVWRKHDVFYPLHLIVWGFFVVLFARATFQYLAGLSWSVMAEEAETKRVESRQLMAYILCTIAIWFCSGVSLFAARTLSKVYVVAAVVIGIILILMTVATDKAIRNLASRFLSFSR